MAKPIWSSNDRVFMFQVMKPIIPLIIIGVVFYFFDINNVRSRDNA